MIDYFARHKVAANVLMLLVLIVGFWAIKNIQIRFLPSFNLNYIRITIAWPNANSNDVKESIIVPVQRELHSITHLKEMKGTARNGSGIISLEFREKADMDTALQRVKSAIARINTLPKNSEKPQVERIEHFDPLAKLIVYGDAPFKEIKEKAYRYENELLRRGIEKITLSGIPEEEIKITASSERLHQMDIDMIELGRMIQEANSQLPAGELGNNKSSQMIRVPRQADQVHEYRNLSVKLHDKNIMTPLGELVTIKKQQKRGGVKMYYNGFPAIELNLKTTENGNSFHSADILHRWYQQQDKSQAIKVIIYEEQWKLIKSRLNLLLKNGALGLIFILVVLFIFLNYRVAFWISAGIPIAVIATLIFTHAIGGSIDMITLFALIMSLGIIVDDTIVVGENAVIQYEHHKDPVSAVVAAGQLMFKPVLASSLTTIAAFIPLIIVSGIIGQIIKVIPITVACVIIASLIECFLILPNHLATSFKAMGKVTLTTWRRVVQTLFHRFRFCLYKILIKPSICHPVLPIVSVIGIFLLTIVLVISGRVPFTFFPSPDSNTLKMNVTFISGTRENKVFSFLQESSEKIKQLQGGNNKKLAIKNIVLVTGSTSDASGRRQNKVGENYGHLNIELYPTEERNLSNLQIIEQINQVIPLSHDIENFELTSYKGGPPGKDIDIKLIGSDVWKLKEASETIQDKLHDMQGVSNIMDSLPYGKEQVEITPKPELAELGLTTEEVGRQLQAAYSNIIIQKLQNKRQVLNVVLSLPEEEKYNNEKIQSFLIRTNDGRSIPLMYLVNLKIKQGFDTLQYSMSDLNINVSAEVNAKVGNASKIISLLRKEVLPKIEKKYGVSYEMRGRAKEQSETLYDMLIGAFVAFSLIYIILLAVFSSYVFPFVILILLPFTIPGAIFGHWLLGYDVTILSLFGIFGLCGIAANDSIVLINYFIEKGQINKNHFLSIRKSVLVRFRAVFLTTITTVVGLLPLLFERSMQAQFLIPMAISISFGLMWAFILVLTLLPALMKITLSFKQKIHRSS